MDNNSNTQTQLNALRTLQQSYDALATASSNGATSVEVENAKQAILDAIGAEVSVVAQESTSQEILSKVNTLTALDSDIASGKSHIAAAISQKGVQTASTDSLAQMAENIGDIQQTTTVIDGGDMYAAQLTGNGALWDLYSVLAQMKSQYMGAGHYAALIVCEYYRGYASLQLQGADAYYTCDGDFYNTSSSLHFWHDDDNGKTNRWVCFLYASEGARLDITNTTISPLSMYIGGHIGTIEYFVNGRLSGIVCGVEDTDVLDNFICNNYTQEWGRDCIIRGIKNVGMQFTTQSSGLLFVDKITQLPVENDVIKAPNINSMIIKGLESIETKISGSIQYFNIPNCVQVTLDGTKTIKATNFSSTYFIYSGKLQVLDMRSLNTLSRPGGFISTTSDLIDVIVGNMTSDLGINRWNPTNVLADATKKAQLIENIKNHILARVSDATGGTQLVFTISTNMYNAISSENITWNGQTMTLADAFLTKNWLLAGA